MITLKTLAQASAQDVFNQVVTHLLTQNAKSTTPGNMDTPDCMYRGDGGLKCAAGCLIGDDEYDKEELENLTWSHLAHNGKAPNVHIEIISSLQRIYDTEEVEVWPTKLKETAEAYDLETPDLLKEKLEAIG
jgi:hypothetical protein